MKDFHAPEPWTIEEQVLEDKVSGLTIQFEMLEGGFRVMRIFGDLPLGNREFFFDSEGQIVATGTAVRGPNCPTWRVNASI